jgi:hypothetical protein
VLKAKAGALAVLEGACECTHHEGKPNDGGAPDPLALLDTHLPCTLAVGFSCRPTHYSANVESKLRIEQHPPVGIE